MKRPLAILAHPDDEGAMADTLARYAQEGTQVGLACAARGKAGDISEPSLVTPANLGRVPKRNCVAPDRPSALAIDFY